jgi:hypothetical protein
LLWLLLLSWLRCRLSWTLSRAHVLARATKGIAKHRVALARLRRHGPNVCGERCVLVVRIVGLGRHVVGVAEFRLGGRILRLRLLRSLRLRLLRSLGSLWLSRGLVPLAKVGLGLGPGHVGWAIPRHVVEFVGRGVFGIVPRRGVLSPSVGVMAVR